MSASGTNPDVEPAADAAATRPEDQPAKPTASKRKTYPDGLRAGAPGRQRAPSLDHEAAGHATITESDPVKIRWVATQFNNNAPEKNDRTAWDGRWDIGRACLETFGSRKDAWSWSLLATGRGRNEITTSGWEPTREETKARVEAAYRALLAKHPGNRPL